MAHINLSDGEWLIMKALWQKSPVPMKEIEESLEEETGWSYATVFMMLKRLISKGAVEMREEGKAKLYAPLISRTEIEPAETDSFLSRVYDGSIGMLVSSLAGRKALTDEDIAELRRILDEAEKEGDKK